MGLFRDDSSPNNDSQLCNKNNLEFELNWTDQPIPNKQNSHDRTEVVLKPQVPDPPQPLSNLNLNEVLVNRREDEIGFQWMRDTAPAVLFWLPFQPDKNRHGMHPWYQTTYQPNLKVRCFKLLLDSKCRAPKTLQVPGHNVHKQDAGQSGQHRNSVRYPSKETL